MAQLFWTQKQDIGPSPRSAFGMAFDMSRSRVLLFGGLTASGLLHDTWEWDGELWTQIEDIGPSPRSNHGLAYDNNRKRIVLFGGTTASGAVGDTWEWDGEEWTQLADTGPAPRFAHALTYDSRRGRVILFGGANRIDSAFADTWAWDGTEWTQEQDTGPTACYDHNMAFDSVRNRVVLFGGVTVTAYTYTTNSGGWFSRPTTNTGYNYTQLKETWEYDATKWTRVQDIGPAARRGQAMTFDGVRTLLYGGQGATQFGGDTWAWDGSHWTQLQDIGPGQRYSMGMVTDTARQRVVLFGGAALNSVLLGDTWETPVPPLVQG
jgi:hypothetical protein